MNRILMTTVAVALFASVSVPAIGAERARTQTETQAQMYAGEANGDVIQAQALEQAQIQAQTYAGEADGDGTQTQALIQAQVESANLATASPEAYRYEQQLRHTPAAADRETADPAPSEDALYEWLSSLGLKLKEAFAHLFGRV